MKIKGLKVEFSYTKNLGNFNSVKINEALEIELEEDDDLDKIKEYGYKNIKDSIKEQIKQIKEG